MILISKYQQSNLIFCICNITCYDGRDTMKYQLGHILQFFPILNRKLYILCKTFYGKTYMLNKSPFTKDYYISIAIIVALSHSLEAIGWYSDGSRDTSFPLLLCLQLFWPKPRTDFQLSVTLYCIMCCVVLCCTVLHCTVTKWIVSYLVLHLHWHWTGPLV